MSFQSHLASLERRHATLSRKIETEMRHPSSDTLTLTEMKRQKLQLKDEINRLKGCGDAH